LKQGCWLYSLVLASASRAASAHGEDVLTSIYAEILSTALCLVFLFLRKDAKPYRAIGFAACVIGLVAENLVLADVPYRRYENMITAAGIIVPLVATFSAVYIAKFLANCKK
jgi:hypothetical protein